MSPKHHRSSTGVSRWKHQQQRSKVSCGQASSLEGRAVRAHCDPAPPTWKLCDAVCKSWGPALDEEWAQRAGGLPVARGKMIRSASEETGGHTGVLQEGSPVPSSLPHTSREPSTCCSVHTTPLHHHGCACFQLCLFLTRTGARCTSI